MLGLQCCIQAFSSCGERGLLFRAVLGLLTVVVSRVVDGAQALGRELSSCGPWAQLLRSLWNPPGPEIKPVSLALKADSNPLCHQGKPTLLKINVENLTFFPVMDTDI